MIDWVSWPLGKNIDKWIIALLKGLAAVKKFSILIEVSLTKIEKVGGPGLAGTYGLCLWSLARDSADGGGRAPIRVCCVTSGKLSPLSGPQVPLPPIYSFN